ncbi:MAG TPA: putative metal-dependent hydrolase [Bacteroidia bacterium]|nr:putative metal-dependent hydrolase [Bacteroidia bacterium]
MIPEAQLENLRFPVGRWQKPATFSAAALAAEMAVWAAFPEKLAQKVAGLSDADLAKTYRPEGWTVRQVVHHCADSHLNCLVRFKLALTEDMPTIKPYAEERWAELADYALPIAGSLEMLALVHARLAHVMTHMQPEDWHRAYIHPQYGTTFELHQVASLYAWHCRHHFGHVELALGGN